MRPRSAQAVTHAEVMRRSVVSESQETPEIRATRGAEARSGPGSRYPGRAADLVRNGRRARVGSRASEGAAWRGRTEVGSEKPYAWKRAHSSRSAVPRWRDVLVRTREPG